ncbi:MAG: tRNA (guanosine(37)-N1)-methyltransferase TrmD [Verrucomicrobia bacterium]|nr:tRNA (guanosine(37)-N1)-methyltransferase TrmD [Verrucomicrobiota bacterium]
MRIDIITLFPRMFEGPLDESILKRARARGLLDVRIHNLREFGIGKHRVTDDRPFGGGPGMVMKPEPMVRCVETLRDGNARVVLLTPQGRRLEQSILQRLSREPHLILICGHYEGVDDRVRQLVVDEEISIGDYVLTNGALPAMVLVDGVARLAPGVLGHEDSAGEESFSDGLLEYPHYTRPVEFRGRKVPDILRSGNHGEIAAWRRRMSEERTREQRPDMTVKKAPPQGR